ncbi:MAG: DegV family protein [Oscillibacter sp.]|nr:DegV family protein [Oscillibacter sp.]
MNEFCLMTDSSCDMDAALADELRLVVVPLSLRIGQETYRNYLDGREIGFKELYDRVRAGEMPTTSAVSVGDFEAAMRPVLAGGRDILYLALSSGLSTTYQSGTIAAQHLKEEFPERRVEVIDSLCASGGQGLFVYLCAKERDAGKSFEEVCAYARDMVPYICHWFTVDDLQHLKRGGRISAATALFGGMLAIKPVLHVDDAGKLINMEKARGRKASILSLVEHMAATARDPVNDPVFITHGDCLDDAEFLAGELRRRFGTKQIFISYVGPVIGSHTGAGVLTVFFVGRPR